MGSRESKQVEPSSKSNLDENNNFNPKLQLTSSLTMPMQITFKCDRCGMIFPTDEALYKHRTRFCIGAVDSGIGRKVYYSDDEDFNDYTNRPRLRKVIEHQSPAERVSFIF